MISIRPFNQSIFQLLHVSPLVGAFSLAVPSYAQDPAIQAQVEELRQSNAALRTMLLEQEERLKALESKTQVSSAKRNFDHSPKNPTESDDEISILEEDPNFISLKKSGDDSAMLQLYGFLRLDAIYDDQQAGLDELLAYAISEDVPVESDDFYLHPKLTRFGADLVGPTLPSLGDAKLTGKAEIDFYRQYNSSESRDEFRMRHAWLKLSWETWFILAGQTFDTISPLYPAVNPDAGSWGIGNLGDRRPQFIVGYTLAIGEGALSVVGAVGQSGANASTEGDDNANYQGRIAYKHPLFGGNFEAGVWGHYADEDGYRSEAYGMDLSLPLGPYFTLTSELWRGQNLDDVRGGIWQPGVLAGREIGGEGGWVELGWKINRRISLHGGYMIDNPDDADLMPGTGAGSRSRNEAYYGAARFNYDPFLFGLDYIHLETDYLGARSGSVNRLQTYMQYNF